MEDALLSSIKPLLKRMLPAGIYRVWWRAKIWLSEKKMKNLDRAAVFDTIYRDRLWGGSQLSGHGSVGEHATTYIDFIRQFAEENLVRTILDVGCGDFEIGSRICNSVDQYFAADVSTVIIEKNKSTYKTIENTKFLCLDLCSDPLPAADLITVREVLQHLSNADICFALNNIERSGARFALITEHLPGDKLLVAPNVDKASGSHIRNFFGSGVYIDRAPFNRPKRDVLSVMHPTFATTPSYLVTSLWDLQRRRNAP